MRNNKFLMLAAIALPMFVGCNENSIDNTDNKSEENVTAVAGITLSASSLSLAVGRDSALTFTISPSNATNKNVTWSSSAPSVAMVTNGVVTAKSAGTATIIVSTVDGGKTATCAVTVVAQTVAVTGVTLSPTTLSLSVGDTSTLTATLSPANATNKAVGWTTSNAAVASVSAAGVVTAVAAGHATITVTTVDGVKTAICVVTVSDPNKVVVSSNYGTYTIRLVNVEGGTFTMGCIESRDGTCEDDELPAHSATLSSYKIGQYEATQELWYVVMGAMPSDLTSYNDEVGDNYPVYAVTWNNVQTFLSRLNTLTGKQFRLPTEAEWEYAARGGKASRGYKYSGSNNIEDVAWYEDNSENVGIFNHIVGTKRPNELGIYDMTGSVSEWCSDLYGSYSADAQTNPTGSGYGSAHRGGSWGHQAKYCRTAFRMSNSSTIHHYIIGFRVALSGE